jgi:hypothetical protein
MDFFIAFTHSEAFCPGVLVMGLMREVLVADYNFEYEKKWYYCWDYDKDNDDSSNNNNGY